MELNELLADLYGRIGEHVHESVDELGPHQLITPPGGATNTIGWLVWHLTRVQDSHIAELLEHDQVWVEGDWAARFGVSADPTNTGYGHSAKEVAAIKPENAAALIEYYDAVFARTEGLLQSTTAEDLDRIVDRNWDPPVTLGARLISVADDCIQHAGQASYARGLVERG